MKFYGTHNSSFAIVIAMGKFNDNSAKSELLFARTRPVSRTNVLQVEDVLRNYAFTIENAKMTFRSHNRFSIIEIRSRIIISFSLNICFTISNWPTKNAMNSVAQILSVYLLEIYFLFNFNRIVIL